MDYRIAPIAEEHIAGFRAAVDSVAREHRFLSILEAAPLDEVAAFVRSNIRNRNPQFVALADAHVVGWCDVTANTRPVYAHSGVLGMGIIAQYRERGIGTALIRAALGLAKENGLNRIELTVREHNARAIALYRKQGFVMEGVKRKAVLVDGVYENLLCMALLFDIPENARLEGLRP